MTKLWSPITVGRMQLPHRLAMAPMTRSRAQADGTPGKLAALYYFQRASMGLLITEGTQPSADGQGYLFTPGIYTDAHIAGWKQVADRVHAAGARLVIQLMHVGRVSHPDNTPHHRQPVAPSALAPGIQMFTLQGLKDIPVPRALSTAEVRATVDDFRRAAAAAIQAGADGVEIHGANGYIVHQFLAENANLRTDEYGGGPACRARFGIEVAEAVAAEIGSDRTGFRISPGNTAAGISEGPSGLDVYRALIPALRRLNLAYLHVMHRGPDDFLDEIRRMWPEPLVVNRAGRPREQIAADVEAGRADIASIAAWSLANPDLVERLRQGAPLNTPDRSTFYGGDAHGYTDYPTLAELAAHG